MRSELITDQRSTMAERRLPQPTVRRSQVDEVDEEEPLLEVLAHLDWDPGLHRLTEEETAKLINMEDELHKRIVGQRRRYHRCQPRLMQADQSRVEGPQAPRRLVHLPRALRSR